MSTPAVIARSAMTVASPLKLKSIRRIRPVRTSQVPSTSLPICLVSAIGFSLWVEAALRLRDRIGGGPAVRQRCPHERGLAADVALPVPRMLGGEAHLEGAVLVTKPLI